VRALGDERGFGTDRGDESLGGAFDETVDLYIPGRT